MRLEQLMNEYILDEDVRVEYWDDDGERVVYSDGAQTDIPEAVMDRDIMYLFAAHDDDGNPIICIDLKED